MAALFNFKSSEVGTLRRGSLQRSSVQSTRVVSESKSNVNISFFTLRNIFIWLWARVALWLSVFFGERKCALRVKLVGATSGYTGI